MFASFAISQTKVKPGTANERATPADRERSHTAVVSCSITLQLADDEAADDLLKELAAMTPGVQYSEVDEERKLEAYFEPRRVTWEQGQKGLVDALDSLDVNWRTLIAFGHSFTYSDEGAQ